MHSNPPSFKSLTCWLVLTATAALILAACTPTAPNVEITSFTDGQRIYGSRNVNISGTASGTSQVRVIQNSTILGTTNVAGGSFSLAVTLDDNANLLRVETIDATTGDEVDVVYPWVNLSTFRPADVMIGQADKTTAGGGVSATQVGDSTYATSVYIGGVLYVPDATNHRVLGFNGVPMTDGAGASFVLGQNSFTNNTANDDNQDGVRDANPTARTMDRPSGVATDGTRLYIADASNKRILIYNTLPTTSFAPADIVIGQDTMTTTEYTPCSLDRPFDFVERVSVGGGKMIVPEPMGHRVLVWNTLPTSSGELPDQVLGQPRSGASCIANDDDQDGVNDGSPSARTFYYPWDAWTDGKRILIADYNNNRVLLWETFPTTDFAPADVVIGQDAMTTRTFGADASSISSAFSVGSNGNQIAIPDYYNSRVLVYDEFPITNGASADHVLGQNSFTATTTNDDNQDGAVDASPSARTIGQSFGVWMGEGLLVVNDYLNDRYALFID